MCREFSRESLEKCIRKLREQIEVYEISSGVYSSRIKSLRATLNTLLSLEL
jgi:hypothetical protein